MYDYFPLLVSISWIEYEEEQLVNQNVFFVRREFVCDLMNIALSILSLLLSRFMMKSSEL